jgi:hypothetical protein
MGYFRKLPFVSMVKYDKIRPSETKEFVRNITTKKGEENDEIPIEKTAVSHALHIPDIVSRAGVRRSPGGKAL